jgi:hypothetical protein
VVELLASVPAYALATFLIVIVPGQGMAMVLKQALISGKPHALASVLGNSTGLLVWGATSAVGLSAIFASSDTAYAILKYTGVAYLFYVGTTTAIGAVKGNSNFNSTDGVRQTSLVRSYRLGLFTNLTNVKAAVYAVAFTPQFVPQSFSLGWGVFLLVCLWAIISTGTYSVIISAVMRVSHLLRSDSARTKLSWVSAIGIYLLGIGILIS